MPHATAQFMSSPNAKRRIPITAPLWLLAAALLIGLSGCRCCCLLEPYASAVDLIEDYPVVWDRWYCPRLDISRAGKPDWCGPINSHLAPCRCVDQPEWSRYDKIWLYPPRYQYLFPNHSFPGPSQSAPEEKRSPYELPESAPLEEEMVPPPPTPGLTPDEPPAEEVPPAK